MVALGAELPTLIDIAKSVGPDGLAAKTIELLSKKTEILEDIPWMTGNLPTGHRITQRTSLPTPTTRMFNQGHTRTKSTRAQIDETCAMYSDYSEVDKALLRLKGGTSFRISEDASHVEGFAQQMAFDIFFASLATNPLKFNGLATRYSDVNMGESAAGAKDGAVIDGGGTGSANCSVWLISWGERTIHGIHPEGFPAGLQTVDKGEQRVTDENGKPFQAEVTYFEWTVGIAVEDWRSVVRIANLDYAALNTGTGAADLYKLIGRAADRLDGMGGTTKLYVNRAVKSFLREQALSKSASTVTFDTVSGKQVMSVQGIPVRVVDALGVAEARLV
jgi:Major capsid protein GP7